MDKARIYCATKSSMQSGLGKTEYWLLEFPSNAPKRIDPLTGWYGSDDMQQQVMLSFATLDAAVAYAQSQGIEYDLEARREVPAIKPKAYADNFRAGRRSNWTH
ncbi:ETC complex I subunit [Roseomonas sp. BN140053]|uniref:ETC complex I subunit n=1 Tax=Roseomonas sp. BN140053 TaxID=3391898 RepID=UPI0039E971E8